MRTGYLQRLASVCRRLLRYFLSAKLHIALGLLCASELYASTSTSAHEINWWHLGSEYKDAPALGWLTITFLIFVYLIVRQIKPSLSLYLESRSQDIRDQIEEGRLAKIEAEKKLKLYDEKLRGLSDEIAKMKEAFERQALAQKQEREQQTKEVEARLLRDADETIRANFDRSKNRLATEVIEKAIVLAEKKLIAMSDEVHAVLSQTLINDISSKPEERSQ